jgi:hypothetical protein
MTATEQCFCKMPPTMTSRGITHTPEACYFNPRCEPIPPRHPEPDTPSAEPGAGMEALIAKLAPLAREATVAEAEHARIHCEKGGFSHEDVEANAREARADAAWVAAWNDDVDDAAVIDYLIRALRASEAEVESLRKAAEESQRNALKIANQHAKAIESARQEGARIADAAREVVRCTAEDVAPFGDGLLRQMHLGKGCIGALADALRGGSPQSSGLPAKVNGFVDGDPTRYGAPCPHACEQKGEHVHIPASAKPDAEATPETPAPARFDPLSALCRGLDIIAPVTPPEPQKKR